MLPRWQLRLVLAVISSASLLLGGLSLCESQADEPQAEATTTEPATRSMAIHAAERETGEPLAGVGLEFHGRLGEQPFNQFLTTDGDGDAQLKWPAKEEVKNLWMTANKTGYVSLHCVWRRRTAQDRNAGANRPAV